MDWIKRSTHLAEDYVQQLGLEDWVQGQRRKKWRFAGHVARREDNRWIAMLSWKPQSGYRDPGHPKKRWTTDLDTFMNKQCDLPSGFWFGVAGQREEWHKLESHFVQEAWFQ